MEIGIVGPKSSGKTTIFKALSNFRSDRGDASYNLNRAVISVPDPRLDALAELFNPKKVTPATIAYLDLPHPGGGDTAKYFQSFRTADALAVVIPVFSFDSTPLEQRLNKAADQYRDFDLSLSLSDLLQIEKKLEMDRKVFKSKRSDRQLGQTIKLLEKLKAHLEEEKPLRTLELTPEEEKDIRGYTFLSLKPQIVILNIGEDDIPHHSEIVQFWRNEFSDQQVIATAGSVEAELTELPPEEAREFLTEYGLKEPALPAFIRASYAALDLISFFTVGEKEVRAWTIARNTPAKKAAGTIHSDMERGFIRAEVIPWDLLVELGSLRAAKEKGLLRLEGKDYIVQDGDIFHVRFAV